VGVGWLWRLVLVVYALKSHGDGSIGRKKHGESRAEQGGSTTYVESVPYWSFKKLLRLCDKKVTP
jgi:hypothetical protein